MKDILDRAIDLRRALETLEPGRELSLALTKLEECQMWAGAAFTVQHGAMDALAAVTAVVKEKLGA